MRRDNEIENILNDIENQIKREARMGTYTDGGLVAMSPREESLRQCLERQKKGIEGRLEDLNAALALLDKSPELESFYDVLRRVGA